MSVVLKGFQERHVDAIVEIVDDTAAKITEAPDSRIRIALAQGTILLAAPTGSGKTLTIASALVRLRPGVPTDDPDARRVVWFWFAPYSDLVDQTMAAIRSETDLTVRDPYDDRELMTTQPGDVFVSTWQNVAISKPKNRKMRDGDESALSIDVFIEQLRDAGYFIGAVVDEAHQNFNTAPQAQSFYIDILRPDFTIMATATPNDADLAQFMRFAGITTVNRLTVSRAEVVREGLNKVGVKAFYFKASEEDEAILDYDEIALRSGIERHHQIKDALRKEGIRLTPLLLVQVENYQHSVDAARAFLLANGFSPEAIGVHTAAEPDKNLRAIAYDESKEVLIFKMAVATGFDVPRAWTLVSLRSARSITFGLQVIGRIMRVHQRLQNRSVEHRDLLEYGHVFLANSEAQAGLRSAADEIRAIASEIRSVTDSVSVIEIAGGRVALTDPDGGFVELLFPNRGRPDPGAPTLSVGPDHETEFVGALFEFVDRAEAELAEKVRDRSGGRAAFEYPLRQDVPFPLQLDREVMPLEFTGLEECIARRIKFGNDVLSLILRPRGSVTMTEEDLFEGIRTEVEKRFAFSLEKAEKAAQLAFRFNDRVDPRDLKAALIRRLRDEIASRDYEEQSDEVLRRTIDIALYRNKTLLIEACKDCMSLAVEVQKADIIPGLISSDVQLEGADKGVYTVFGPRMNDWEHRFARELDRDMTGSVLWWMRNIENARWACRIIRPNGKSFYPDFVIGIAGRKKPDNIALAEVKERIETEDSAEKTRVEHKTYGSALMVTWDEAAKRWEVVGFSEALGRNVVTRPYDVSEFAYLS